MTRVEPLSKLQVNVIMLFLLLETQNPPINIYAQVIGDLGPRTFQTKTFWPDIFSKDIYNFEEIIVKI